jgi:flagellar basal body-associated protein FliL
MLFAGIFRNDPMDNKSERSKSQMILRYGTYIFYLLVVLLLIFIYFYVSKLQEEQNLPPAEKVPVEAPADTGL